jgi:hypothetical protein
MFATIRRYTPKSGMADRANLDTLRQQLQDGFVPMVQDIPGFHGYYAVNVAGKELVTLSIFDTREAATESTRAAGNFTNRTDLPFDVGKPEVIEGDVLAFAESRREVGA